MIHILHMHFYIVIAHLDGNILLKLLLEKFLPNFNHLERSLQVLSEIFYVIKIIILIVSKVIGNVLKNKYM